MTENIWQEFNEQLLAFIRKKVNDSETARDILQEVFIKIHQNKSGIQNNQKITNWIYQVTRNTIIDYYRKHKIKASELPPEELTPEKLDVQNTDFSNCIAPFIKRLSKKDQDILNAITFRKISQKEYARIHNLSYSATKSRVQRAREKLGLLFLECCDIQADTYGNIISYSQKKPNNC